MKKTGSHHHKIGQTLVEYALVLGFVSVVSITLLLSLRDEIFFRLHLQEQKVVTPLVSSQSLSPKTDENSAK